MARLATPHNVLRKQKRAKNRRSLIFILSVSVSTATRSFAQIWQLSERVHLILSIKICKNSPEWWQLPRSMRWTWLLRTAASNGPEDRKRNSIVCSETVLSTGQFYSKKGLNLRSLISNSKLTIPSIRRMSMLHTRRTTSNPSLRYHRWVSSNMQLSS